MQTILVGLLFKSVSMTIVGLIFIFATPLFLKRYRAKWLYYGWLIILIGYIVPFTFNTTTKVINIVEPVHIASQKQLPIQATKETLISTSVDTFSMLSLWQMLMILWVSGILTFWAYHLVGHYRFMKMVKRWGETVEDSGITHLLERLKSEMNITVKVSIKECDFIHSPMIVGFVNRSILLPINEYSEAELKTILKHELVHLKRKDLWYKAFVMIICGIHWFNPLLYIFAREIDNLCERSCDEEVVKNGDIELRKTYSQTILYAEKNKRRESIFSTNFLGGTQNTKKRIFSIMNMNKKKSGIIVMILLLLLTTCGFIVSSTFAISSKPVSYLDGSFMKEDILKGALKGDFSTGEYIIYPKSMEMKPVPFEPDKNEELFRDVLPIGIVAYEARYKYPIEIVHRNQGEKYTTLLFIEYDYELFEPIEYDELNTLIASYLLNAEDMFKSISYVDFNADYLLNKMQEYKKYIDEHNTDTRVNFTFNFNGIQTNLNLPIPEGLDFGFYSTPRYIIPPSSIEPKGVLWEG